MIDRVAGVTAAMKHQLAGGINPSGRMASADEIARVLVDVLAGDTEFDSGSAVLAASEAVATRAG